MKKYVVYTLVLLTFLSYSCNSMKIITDNEKAFINSGDGKSSYRVLLTTNADDSLALRKKSIDIPNIKDMANDKSIQLFLERLKLTMVAESGVGIAAPQVGLNRNIFLFFRIDKPGYPIQVAINPKIVNHPKEFISFEGDGCLSVPERSGTTARYSWVDVEYYDENGTLIKEKLSGSSRQGDFTGIIFQHEYDHLKGVLFIDKLVENKEAE